MNARERELTPVSGPPGRPLIGHLWDFQRDRLGFLADCYHRYGETTLLQIVSRTFVLNNPQDIRHVLVTREENYRKSWRVLGQAGRRLFARALLTKSGAAHRRQRRLVQPSFHRHVVAAFAGAIDAHLEPMLRDWAERESIDVCDAMDRFAEDVLIRALLGEMDGDSRRSLSEANRARRRFINHAFNIQFPFPQLLPTRRNWEYRSAARRQKQIIRDYVQRTRNSTIGSDSLLAQMAATTSLGGERLSDDDLFEEVWELLTAGFETTRDGLTWALYLLAKHPDCAARVRAEVRQVVGECAVAAEDVPRLLYSEMFFSEALRLYPPVWLFVRVAVEDDILTSGVQIPAGSKIFLCQYTAHRNEECFPDPERFDPERFLAGAGNAWPRFAYFPFGAGRRVCVAESLARLEGVLLLSSVARRFDLELCPGQNVEPVGAITLRPRDPIRVAVRPAEGR